MKRDNINLFNLYAAEVYCRIKENIEILPLVGYPKFENHFLE